MDVEPFRGMIPEWPKNEVAEILKKEMPKISKAIETGRRPPLPVNAGDVGGDDLSRLEALMPGLFSEMRDDLKKNPLQREFIIMSNRHMFNSGGKQILVYYYEDHDDLTNEVGVLVNSGAVADITYNNADRYLMSEALVEYLARKHAA